MANVAKRPIATVEDVYGFFRAGTVAGASTWSETHVSATTRSDGGGGTIYEGAGHISAGSSTTQISSNVIEVTRFFLNYGDDAEEEFTLKGGRFPLRNEHTVSVIRVGPRGEHWGYNVAYYNHSTKTTHAEDTWLKRPLKRAPSKALLLLSGGLVGLAVITTMITSGHLTSPAVFLTLIPFGAASYFYFRKTAEYQRLVEAARACRQQQLEAAKAAHASRKSNAPQESAST